MTHTISPAFLKMVVSEYKLQCTTTTNRVASEIDHDQGCHL